MFNKNVIIVTHSDNYCRSGLLLFTNLHLIIINRIIAENMLH